MTEPTNESIDPTTMSQDEENLTDPEIEEAAVVEQPALEDETVDDIELVVDEEIE